MNLDDLTNGQTPGTIPANNNQVPNNISPQQVNNVAPQQIPNNNIAQPNINTVANQTNTINSNQATPTQIPNTETIQNNPNNNTTPNGSYIPSPTNTANTIQPPQINVNVGGRGEEVIHIEGLVPHKSEYGIFRIFTIIVLIITGIMMLLESSNILKFNILDFQISLLYPIIVLLSTVVLFSYKHLIGKIIGLILFVITVGGRLGIATFHSFTETKQSKFNQNIAYQLSNNTGDTNAIIHLTTYIGNYNISGDNTNTLLEGKYISDRELKVSTGLENKIPYLYLEEDNNWNILQKPTSDMNIVLNKNIETDLYIKNFIGNYNLDLSNIKRKSLQINEGIGDINITIGKDINPQSNLKIKAVQSKMVINIPKNIGVQLYYKQLAGGIELTNFNKPNEDGIYYESLNLKKTTKTIKLEVDTVIGDFKINWVN